MNASIEAVNSVIPNTFEPGSPSILMAPILQTELGVLIGITGDVRGRLIVSTTTDVLARIGESMYGIELDDEMVKSFASEFTNMIAGHMVRLAEGLNMDISPPTTLEGETKLYGFNHGVMVPLVSKRIGTVRLALVLEGI
ncbi:MAG: chemotaxis protein CheX [Alicyclobacillus macrosporangiidus]|uniref:chemotaxis protein CheX n=1 Tax=Alicyclobacillus macrosporangiidus TaxID=392015 RepID=UPI0026EF6F88|nr:chemotaxis protein CheX [Alicyclobacillus macrosporangiidus]MCL6600196.1 chemotaxis protein CheX [Alicyclobacillus macrosporangiidus]